MADIAKQASTRFSIVKRSKGQKSQLARMLKASLPNEWSYELAEEVVRDYVQRNFVDKGMCADWEIHGSENDKGQHNLHNPCFTHHAPSHRKRGLRFTGNTVLLRSIKRALQSTQN